MTPKPEDIAREQIDRMLISAGWAVQDAKAVNLYAKQGVQCTEKNLTVMCCGNQKGLRLGLQQER